MNNYMQTRSAKAERDRKTIFYQLDVSIRVALDLALVKKGPPVRQGRHLMQPILTATRMRGTYREPTIGSKIRLSPNQDKSKGQHGGRPGSNMMFHRGFRCIDPNAMNARDKNNLL